MKKARDPALIRQAMADRGGLSHRELALLAECSVGTIGFVLDGRRVNPELARVIARRLRRPVDELFVSAEANGEQPVDDHRDVA